MKNILLLLNSSINIYVLKPLLQRNDSLMYHEDSKG